MTCQHLPGTLLFGKKIHSFKHDPRTSVRETDGTHSTLAAVHAAHILDDQCSSNDFAHWSRTRFPQQLPSRPPPPGCPSCTSRERLCQRNSSRRAGHNQPPSRRTSRTTMSCPTSTVTTVSRQVRNQPARKSLLLNVRGFEKIGTFTQSGLPFSFFLLNFYLCVFLLVPLCLLFSSF